MSNSKRLLIYIVPVTVLSFALNTPKFMEVTLTKNNGTNEVDPSTTRRDPNFIFWYTLSLIWHPTLTTGVLPFIGLVYMNLQIFIGIRQSRQVRALLYLGTQLTHSCTDIKRNLHNHLKMGLSLFLAPTRLVVDSDKPESYGVGGGWLWWWPLRF